MKQLLRILALLTALSVIAAACGSEDGSGDTAVDDETTESTDSEATGEDEAAEENDAAEDDEAMEEDAAAGDVLTDVGVTDEEIRLGVITDLTGPFAGLTVPITDGLEAYWEWVNANGGVAGREVVLDIQDAGYDIDAHGVFYDQMADTGGEGSVMLQMSLGSPMTASIREDLVDDSLAAIPLSWNSSWSTENGGNVFEWLTNYCIEGMNGIEWMAENRGVTKVAVIGRAGDYGEDGSLGAKRAIEELGLELVYDGQGQVVPGADPTPVATGIADSGAELVWTTVGPADLGAVMGRAIELGYEGLWAGNGPSYNQVLLDTPLAPALGAAYTHFTPFPTMNPEQSEGMAEVVAFMQEFRPDAQYFGVYIDSYVMGEIARQGLEAAAANGDLTRQGVVDALTTTEIDLKGLAPNIVYDGDPNDVIPRETFVLEIQPDLYDSEATMTTGVEGSDGLVMIEEGYIGSVAENFSYEPCFGI